MKVNHFPHITCFLIFILCVFFSGCASTQSENYSSAPNIAYALQGPPLNVQGVYRDIKLTGELERKAMVGVGKLKLYSENTSLRFFCEANIASTPTDKGRVRVLLDCSDGEVIGVLLRNLGPDQGVGAGTSLSGDHHLTLFYHPSKEEAARRLAETLVQIDAIRIIQILNQR